MTIVDDNIQEKSEFFTADVKARAEDASRVKVGSQTLIEIRDCEWLTLV